MNYSDEHALEAWKTFMGTGIILEEKVRPEVAASWKRCKSMGLDPWSSGFEKENTTLLREKRQRFQASLRATTPVMKFLTALLGSNVSLMDGENFVFELMSPMSLYSRTYGTYMREKDVGTGNATLVATERRPVRIDGFEHYRAIAQSYSGVAAPYLDNEGRYFGAMNINSPFRNLPPEALDLCVRGVELTQVLFQAARRAPVLLSTTEFFKPLLNLYRDPVMIVDVEGHVLNANAPMRAYCPDWEDFSYGSQSIEAYLGKSMTFKDVVRLGEHSDEPVPVPFRKGRSRSVVELPLVRCRLVEIEAVEPFYLLVFESEKRAAETVDRAAGKRQKTRRDVTVMPSGETVDYIGETDEWKAIDKMVRKVAPIRTNVLLLGETGTGKEVVARALHRNSGRKGPFVAVNCGALPRDLLATELFGYEGGAFTGAREDGAMGKFEFADGGTLFLDEIGEMPVDMQVSLLRVLQESSVTKLGSNTAKTLDLRVVAATNQNIQRLIAEKQFRSDLYYRLSMVEMRLPELRKRRDDIPLLVAYFNEQLSAQLNVPLTPVPEETVNALRSYSWPGNVRELRNVVERCLIMEGEGAKIGVSSLPFYIENAASSANVGPLMSLQWANDPRGLMEAPAVSASDERQRIKEAFSATGGQLAQTARQLGISEEKLQERMQTLGLKARVVLDDEDDISNFVRW
ncbi:sigma-54 dependent transcriptional regulator [Adlercreutzia equolifaciens]|uniref:sigma-54 interaction domain-containing protein n=1 Tax=Adlercreutzia equolifaciens TaxID=446660 RepID=UPI0023B013D8|nr:sigma-54 dependent transcriptional regulator [Adlercreutzia equolifaciens]MDE8702202.1 sigma-54 dependent transcriptional regulator [Adlercreutzia equolifaciens]